MNKQTAIKKPEPDNLRVWNALAKTDPKHTKPFSRAGGFKGTAVKPIWVVKMLTEQFGPCGEGWGIGEPHFQVVPGDNREMLVYCTVQCWHGSPANVLYGVGGDKIVTHIKANQQYNRPERWENDDEAFKKAFTDAVNNAFKFVGVAADVHMGQFDDSKYVQALAKEFEAANEGKTGDCAPKEREGDLAPTALKASLKLLVHHVNGAGDYDELNAILEMEDSKIVMEQCARRAPAWWETGEGMPAEFTPLKDLIEGRKAELKKLDDAARVLRAG